MHSPDRLSLIGPESKGAALLPEDELRQFLEDAIVRAQEAGSLCGLVSVHLVDSEGRPLISDDQHQAAQMVSQLMRQADAVGVMSDGSLAIVLHELERRGDAHVMVDRLESFARSAGLPWTLVIGVGVYPLSGNSPSALFDACRRDLEGAMTSETWEHLIPRDTLLTRTAG